MKIARSSHSLCYLNNYIYIIGGKNENGILSSCERFDINNKTSEFISELNEKSYACYSVGFNYKSIFKFGGFYENGSLNNSIERYDLDDEKWTECDPDLPE